MLRCVLSALVALFLLPSLAAAADLKQLVDQLGGDDFSAKIQAVQEIGALGDGRAVAVLKALNDGSLYVTADHKVAVAESADGILKLFDPVDHSPSGGASTIACAARSMRRSAASRCSATTRRTG